MLMSTESYNAWMEQQNRKIKNMKAVKNNIANLVIKTLKEMQLNYSNQYPNKIPDMNLIINLIGREIK